MCTWKECLFTICEMYTSLFIVNIISQHRISYFTLSHCFIFSISLSGSWYRWESGNFDIWRVLCFLQNDVIETGPLFVALELQWQERSPNCGRIGSVFEGGAKGIIKLLNVYLKILVKDTRASLGVRHRYSLNLGYRCKYHNSTKVLSMCYLKCVSSSF